MADRQGRAGGARRRARRGLLVGVAALYALSIPWYRDAGAEPAMLLGLPDWVTVAVACYVGAAILNAAAWLLTDFEDGAR